jgi:hypothetical protein
VSKFWSLRAIEFRTPARQETTAPSFPHARTGGFQAAAHPRGSQIPNLASSFFSPGQRWRQGAALHSRREAAGRVPGTRLAAMWGRRGPAADLGLLAAAGSRRRPTEGGQQGPPWSTQRPARQRHRHNARAPACSPPGRLKVRDLISRLTIQILLNCTSVWLVLILLLDLGDQ